MGKRKRDELEFDDQPLRRSKRLRKISDSANSSITSSTPVEIDWTQWVSATATKSYMMRDPLCDWLSNNYTNVINRTPKYTQEITHALKDNRSPTNFTSFIMEQGNVFESHVIKLLYQRFGEDTITDIGCSHGCVSPDKVQETVDAMNRGVPFIYSGSLRNYENQTYGIPDLLVRSDWINKLVKIDPVPLSDTKIPSPLLTSIHDPEKSPDYHYLVIDIKFTTILLRSDATHIVNSGLFPAYKAQLLIYNQALAKIQGYDPKKVYVLGRRWKFTHKGEPYRGDNCFDRLGVIDYRDTDKEYVNKTVDAIAWVRQSRSEEARNWKLTDPPLSRPELYPNMCNSYDYPWHQVKSQIAKELDEITCIWNVGTRHRSHAHKEGVYKWSDPRCTPDILGIKGKFTSRIVDKILKINQPHRSGTRNIRPKIIKNNLADWQNPQDIEFYVDFETVNDILTDFSDLPKIKTTSLIFMIGVGHLDPVSEKWTYKNFTVHDLSLKEERRICQEFSEYILRESDLFGVKDPLCVHWSHAEDTFWNGAIDRHPEDDDMWGSDNWQWFDLLKVFKEEPITIKGCLTFRLKDIAKTLYRNGCIKSCWDTTNSCSDGLGAMIGAWNAYKESKIRKIRMSKMPQMKDIARYNEVDVKVLCEIVNYLRQNRTGSS